MKAQQLPLSLFVALCALHAWTTMASGQISSRISGVYPLEAHAGRQLTVTVELSQLDMPAEIYFLYRPFGETEFRQLQMDRVGSTASVSIGARQVSSPFLEYYIVFVDETGAMETYPLTDASNPLRVPPARTERIIVSEPETTDDQILFLSPEPFAVLYQDEVLISVSLLRADSSIDRRMTRLFLDKREITDEAIFADDIIVYSPENRGHRLLPGNHTVAVHLITPLGVTYRSASLEFTIRQEQGFVAATDPLAPVHYSGSLRLESRHENIRSVPTTYNRGTLSLQGRSDEWVLRGNAHVTSEERRDRQPQNRFQVGIESSWLTLSGGDVYPLFPSLILNGKRVRGVNAAVRTGPVNLDLAFGETVRNSEGSLLQVIPIDSLAAEQSRDPLAAFAPIDAQSWGKYRYGTYTRNIIAVRPSFGSKEEGQFGISFLKGKDDVTSISNGIRPSENLVIGLDAVRYFDAKRIELSVEAAISAINSDISSGTFDDAYIDSTYTDTKDDVKRIRGLLDGIITVNDNLRPLSLKTLSTVAWDAALSLQYFGHVFRVAYLFRGNDYNSFGQTFLRTDIRGFNVGDRFRLFDNQLLLSAQFERLQDNISHTKIATTTFTSSTIAGSYYSRMGGPGYTISIGLYGSDNGITRSSADSLSMIDETTFRLFAQSNYSFTLGATHTALASFSYSKRSDQSVRAFDVTSTVLSVGVSTRYDIPLQTSFDLTTNLSTQPSMGGILSNRFDYTALSFGARYFFLRNTVQLFTTISPTLGDYSRTTFDLGAQYFLTAGMIFEMQFSYFRNPGFTHDNVWSLRYRYNL